MEGSVVAIADKLDTICGIIGVGLLPTGSKDPFALRRAANGIVQIIAEKGLNIDMSDLVRITFRNLTGKLDTLDNNIDYVYGFMKQRINWFLQEKGIDYDIIDSVMHIDHNNIPDLFKRAMALQELKSSSSFINLVTGFKRVSNIIEKFQSKGPLTEVLLQEKSEIKLFKEFSLLKKKINEILKTKKYSQVLQMLITYGKFIDEFFDNVLINVEDEELRTNRYELLLLIRKLFLKVADLSKIVIEGN
jgi:glycyl-tRNA synthetase beta chain